MKKYADYSCAPGDFKRLNSKGTPKYIRPSRAEEILADYRVGLTHLTKEIKYCTYPSSSDKVKTLSKGKALSRDSTTTWMAARDSVKTTTNYKGIILQSSIENKFWLSNINDIEDILFGLVCLGACVWLIYGLLRYVIKHVYGIEIFSECKVSSTSVKSLVHQGEIISPQIFLVGLPRSGKSACIDKLKKFIEKKGKMFDEINWKGDKSKETKKMLIGDADYVFLSHFEYGINDHDLNKKKLEVLEKLSQNPQTKVIIASCVQPSAILDFYEIMIERALSKDKSDEAYTEIKEFRLAFRQWQNILCGFATVYQPLLTEDAGLLRNYKNDSAKRTMEEELRHGDFLRALEPLVFQYGKSTGQQKDENEIYKPDEEDLILRVEILADTYYQSLWNSFTRKEKFLLFDLAKDRFVNTNNIKEIKILVEKGVIRMADSIQLMNKSFNNFILSVVREDEEMLMEREVAQKGTWKTVQLVLFLSLLGLAIFFTLAQQNLLQNFNAMLTAIGAVLALVVRFGGFFGTGVKQKET